MQQEKCSFEMAISIDFENNPQVMENKQIIYQVIFH